MARVAILAAVVVVGGLADFHTQAQVVGRQATPQDQRCEAHLPGEVVVGWG
jgi:hypothetical protein